MRNLVWDVAAATEQVGQALLRERGTRGSSTSTPVSLQDAALWTAGTPRLDAVLRAADSPRLTEAVAKARPARRRSLSLAASLAGPVPVMLALGADDRVIPTAGRNSYRMPLADEQPRLRASSCTATPPDAQALAVAEQWRDDLLTRTLAGRQPEPSQWHADVATRLVDTLGLDRDWAERVVLSPSGTDVASLLTTLVQGAHGRGVAVITVGARSRVRHVARGRTQRVPRHRGLWRRLSLRGAAARHPPGPRPGHRCGTAGRRRPRSPRQ